MVKFNTDLMMTDLLIKDPQEPQLPSHLVSEDLELAPQRELLSFRLA